MEAWRLADLHAYVDECLEPDDRLAFERKMAEDSALARRASMWRAQNSAICSAFDGEGPKAFSISIVRHQNDALPSGRQPSSVSSRSPREPSPRSSWPRIADASGFAANVNAPSAFRPLPVWRLATIALSLGLACVWSSATPVIPAKALGVADVAAFQAFARPGVVPVEFAAADSARTQEWLTARLLRPVYLPATPATVSLLGARIAPYPGAPAAFVVYKFQDRLVALLVQSLDAPTTKAPELISADGSNAIVWTWRGQGLALVGDLDASSLMKIAAGFLDLPAEAIQTTPERGS